MKVTYKDIPGTHYNESQQNNPIRWVCLAKVDTDTYESVTMPFKCKDYFNDFVIYKQTGHVFSAHGMCSDEAKFCERDGLYVLVYNTTPEFAQNVKNVLQPTFGDAWGASVEITPLDKSDVDGLPQNDGFAILWFSPECLVSTFRISVLALLIRNCNVPFEVKDYDERIDRNLISDGNLSYTSYVTLKDRNFTFPEQAEYAWYAGPTYNSKGAKAQYYILHDNGLQAWGNQAILNRDHDTPDRWYLAAHTLGPAIQAEDEEFDWDDESEEEEEEV